MNLNEEMRNGYLISREMKLVWKVQMEMLSLLLDICKRHNLKIWASSGTLLGCIRDKGYIPWDDDIDMVMMRGDYDKLLEIAPSEVKYPFFFQSAYTESSAYPRGHAQMRASNTSAILPMDIFRGFNQGIFIDIFVFDAIPDSDDRIQSLVKDIAKRRHTIQKWSQSFSLSSRPAKLFDNLRNLIYRKTHSFMKEYRLFDRTISKYSIADYQKVVKLGLISDYQYVTSKALDKSLYIETLWLPFEDILMPVPIGYDIVLRTLYGDYLKPVKAPSFHGGFALLDVSTPYTESLATLRKAIRRGKAKRWVKSTFGN